MCVSESRVANADCGIRVHEPRAQLRIVGNKLARKDTSASECGQKQKLLILGK